MSGGFMDFVERWFDISPDGGNGTFEVLCILVAIVGVLAILCRDRLIHVGRHSIGRTQR
jgi:hypothetical protein